MTIELTNEEAILLSELLYRISEKEEYYEDVAEQYVLWRIEAQLDKMLAAPFKANYAGILKSCRDTVRNNYQKII